MLVEGAGSKVGSRHAYKRSDPPMTNTKKANKNTPLLGSIAKACTEVRIPERTKKVPIKLSEKAQIDNKIIQPLKRSHFSLSARMCSKAAPVNQGKKEAFSTGSQNHQPPHPNSR